MNNSLGNCGHFDDCRKCMCYACKSTEKCGNCINCTGSVSMSDDPYANYKETCDEFKQAKKAKIEETVETKPLIIDSAYYKDDICRKHARASRRFSEAAKEDIISRIKERNKKYENDFTSYQIARQDEIENAIFEMIKVITCDDLLSWDMEVIGDVADVVCDVLSKKGYLIYYPNITQDENDNFSISDFYGI